ncbi:MAG: UDP-2,4-diacetamido-2,4,6-trideoxy-beta-L-altropyranose hydrolase [Rhodospirillales bacterium]|nr:MAG: UDP-2,4-diacetamido-2,4,6-trideoxy-beta-L-altropyranose hydrolase [Rhodospirillales bacterium]
MRVAIRADASARIGSGHVMRCLTLAESLRARGAEVHFVCRAHAGHMAARIEAAGFAVTLLPAPPPVSAPVADADYAAWLGVPAETDAHQMIVALDGWRPDWLVVDHYALDARWQQELRPHCDRIMVIDDLADRDHDCDLLLDQNLVSELAGRYDGCVSSHCGRLLGPDYALLQPRYAELHPRTPPRTGRIQRIFVFFGMVDDANLTGRTIAAFLALERPDIGLDVVIDPESAHAAALREQATAHAHIILHGPLPSLARLMMKADLAIGAGGATSWERCCLGLPSLVVTLAENQTPIAAALDRQGCIRWLGHRDTVSEDMLTSALQEILKTGPASEMSRRCLALVDGRGTDRVAGIMALRHETRLTARLARVDDEALILRWANDPLARRNAFNPAAIDPDGHRAWFHKRLRDPDGCRIYIVETEHGLPIGQVRFELSDDGWTIDYALDASVRGQKLGANLLQSALHAFRRSMRGALVFGRVKADNRPSRNVFERLGFTAEAGGGQLVYRRLL